MLPLLATAGSVVLISAFCSLCEAVLYALPATHINRLEEEGHPAAARLAWLRSEIDRPITAILTVNTVANTAGAAIAGGLATKALGEGNVVAFSAALTISILLFSEIIPKTIGVVHTRTLAPLLARPLTWMVVVLTPVIALISKLTNLLAGESAEVISQEEIASMARMGSHAGVIDEGEAAVIQNILSLPTVPVGKIMTPRTVTFCLPHDRTVGDALTHDKLMIHSRIPLYAEGIDDIVGMVFQRDVLACDDETMPLSTLLRPVEFVGQTEPVDQALEMMLAYKQHMLVVLGEFGGFAGVLTLEDVLEEILGAEIVDEFDQVADMRELAKRRRAAALDRMGTTRG